MMVCKYVRTQLRTPIPPAPHHMHIQPIYSPQEITAVDLFDLPEDPAERRGGPVVSGVVPAEVGRARHWDEAQAPASQVLLVHCLFIRSTLLCIHKYFHATIIMETKPITKAVRYTK